MEEGKRRCRSTTSYGSTRIIYLYIKLGVATVALFNIYNDRSFSPSTPFSLSLSLTHTHSAHTPSILSASLELIRLHFSRPAGPDCP